MTTITEPTTRQAASDRTPPHDLDAEQCVLGGMMLSKDAIADAVEIINAASFYHPHHTTIFNAITALYGEGQPADAITVAGRLDSAGELMRVGGGPYLHTCLTVTPTAANTSYYARMVKDKAKRRELIEAGTKIVQAGYGPADSADSIADLAQRAVYEVTAAGRKQTYVPLPQLIQLTLDQIEAAGDNGGGLLGVPTGFADLDRLTNGLQAGQLILVAGRPGQGKSTLSLDLVRHAAIKRRIPTALFNLEMSSVEIMLRLLSAEARVPLNVLRSGQLSDADWGKLGRTIGDISEAPIFVDDTPNMTMLEVTAKSRRLKQQHNVSFFHLDYLQLVSGTGRTESRQQEVADLSRGLKVLAKELESPFVAVAQLNRGPEQRTDKRPQLSDLRDSGSLEQDADIVILVHRDDYYDKESPRKGEADLIVAKHRNGPTDTITVASQLHVSRFVDMAIG